MKTTLQEEQTSAYRQRQGTTMETQARDTQGATEKKKEDKYSNLLGEIEAQS